jgi:diguanylate cyclase (GGDEF)-like protein/PAS domain S-box-containing protein
MIYGYTPYVLALLVSTALMIGLALYVWRGSARQALPLRFTSVLLLAALWSFGFALEIAIPDLATKIFFSNLEFTAIVLLPVAVIALAMQFTGRVRLYRVGIFLAGAFAFMTILLVWTGSLHSLFRYDYHLVQTNGFSQLVGSNGPWYWVFSVTANLTMLAAFVILIEYMFRAPRLYRRQTFMMVVALLLPQISNSLYLLNITPLNFFNFTPMVFVISGLIVLLGVVDAQLLEVIPIARATIIDKMQDGIIVMDARNQVVDINPMGCKLVEQKMDDVIGRPIQKVLARWPEVLHLYGGASQAQGELKIVETHGTYYYELQIHPILAPGGRVSGRLAIIRNITDRKRTEEELRFLGTHDSLTGLYNRTFFEAELLRLEKSRQYPISILVVDLDGVKLVNDRFGHDVGDELFRLSGQIFRSVLRGEDVAARIGGDEFAILLPRTDEKIAIKILNRLQAAVQNQPNTGQVQVSMSIGAATALVPADLRSTMKLADARMYENKGRKHSRGKKTAQG